MPGQQTTPDGVFISDVAEKSEKTASVGVAAPMEAPRRPKKSLVNKLRWPIVISVVMALLLVSYVQIRTSGEAQRRQIFRAQQGAAEDIAISVTSYLQRAEDGLRLLAQTRDLMSVEHAEQHLTIERLLIQWQDVYEEITLLNQDGDEVARVSRFYTYLPEELGNRSQMAAFQQALAGEAYLADEVIISPYSSLPTVEIAVPVSDSDTGDIVGVLMADASVKRMWDVIAGAKAGETGYAYVINDAGRLQAHSDLAQYLRLQSENLSDTPAMERIAASPEELNTWVFTGMDRGSLASSFWWILFPPRVWEYVGLGGEEVVSAWASIEETPWTVVVDLPMAEAYAELREMTLTLLGMLGVVAVAIGGVTSVLPQLVVRPLARLEKGARLLSSGQLDHRIFLSTEDELEALANTFNQMAERLQELYAGLEQKVADRTRDLERRAVQLEAAADVAREAAAIREVDRLLDETVRLISERFGFYHAGIFLLDDVSEYAVLRAALSEGGRRMLERGHRLKVGEVGIVGYVAGSGEPRIALDVGKDAVFFDNPDLPRTRSEMALPLEVHGEIIGVLDVQSTEEAAFTDEDVGVLQTMADQVALAIENARLLKESRRTLQELRMAHGEYIRSAWGDVVSSRDWRSLRAFEYDRIDVKPVDPFPTYETADRPVPGLAESPERNRLDGSSHYEGKRGSPDGPDLRSLSIIDKSVAALTAVNRALETGEPVAVTEPDNGRSTLAAPLRLRDQVIGILSLEEMDEARPWTEDEIQLVKEVSEQVTPALESARLFEEAQRRAEEQAVLNQLGQTLTAQLNVDEVLEETYRGASRLVDTTNFYIALYDATAGSISFPLAIEHGEPVEWSPRDLGEGSPSGLTEHIIRSREPLLIREDVAQRLKTLGIEMIGRPAFSWLGVPLVVGGEVLGVMAVQSYQVDGRMPPRHRAQARSRAIAYDEHDRELLTAVASQAAIALESAKLYEEALETAERLREVDRLKSQFLANMSHELRTPLNSIIGFSRVVLKGIDGPITDRQREDLEAIFNSGQHLLGLINDILDVSKIEAGKMELDFEPVTLDEIIHGVMSTAIALVKEKPIELQQVVPDDLPTITADERRVRQILLNLVSNAAKFTDEGFIRVAAECEAGQVCMSVKDTGRGIADEELESVFEPFTQVDASTTREHGGTGLGLTISHSFVQLHGGRMWVESDLGEGSTFYFTLPIEGPPSHVEDGDGRMDEKSPLRRQKEPEEASGPLVLCVDDDTGVINLYRRYLHLRGYRVFGLSDSRRVLDVAKRLDPYAITLDVMMPQKDGWDVIRELKGDPRTSDIPVIICSIVSEEERGMSLGAADYLVKPIMEEDLVTALDRLDEGEGGHQVLVVDDHAEDRHLLRRMIESYDGGDGPGHRAYEVVEAVSGEEAIALVEELRPDIIILDLMMPEVDGFAVLESIKSNQVTRSIPVIVVTAKELTEGDHRRLNNRVEALVHKGVLEQEELLEDVAAALQKLDRRRG